MSEAIIAAIAAVREERDKLHRCLPPKGTIGRNLAQSADQHATWLRHRLLDLDRVLGTVPDESRTEERAARLKVDHARAALTPSIARLQEFLVPAKVGRGDSKTLRALMSRVDADVKGLEYRVAQLLGRDPLAPWPSERT